MDKDKKKNIFDIILFTAIIIVDIVALFWPEALVAALIFILGPILILEIL